MADDRSSDRNISRRRDHSDYKNRYRHEDRSRNDRSRKRERSRSRQRYTEDDSRPKRYKNETREHNHHQHKRREHSKKFDLSDTEEKHKPEPTWGKICNKPTVQKEEPNFALSGKLTEDTNTVNGIVIKYAEPSDAKKPKRRWRLYPWKGEKDLPIIYIHRQSGYLMGRDRKVADIPLDHPSCSKQHAALQFRLVPFKRENGTTGRCVKPYLIDLESANGTFVNNVKLEARRYHELFEKDVIKFGYSSRDYVLLHENSKDSDEDDDVGPNDN